MGFVCSYGCLMERQHIKVNLCQTAGEGGKPAQAGSTGIHVTEVNISVENRVIT